MVVNFGMHDGGVLAISNLAQGLALSQNGTNYLVYSYLYLDLFDMLLFVFAILRLIVPSQNNYSSPPE